MSAPLETPRTTTTTSPLVVTLKCGKVSTKTTTTDSYDNGTCGWRAREERGRGLGGKKNNDPGPPR